jgi:hypothetical protein
MKDRGILNVPGVSLPYRAGDGGLCRDMDLARALLLEIERPGSAGLDAWPDEVVRAHLRLLAEAGLIVAACEGGSVECPAVVVVEGMSWAGHDFLAAVRRDKVWRKVRERLIATGGGLAFEAIRQYALKAGGLL